MTRTYSYLSIHRILAMGLTAVTLISIFAYVSLTVAVIFATAGRSRAIAQSTELTSHIGELESTYLQLSNGITASEATTRGLVAPGKVSIVTPATVASELTISTR